MPVHFMNKKRQAAAGAAAVTTFAGAASLLAIEPVQGLSWLDMNADLREQPSTTLFLKNQKGDKNAAPSTTNVAAAVSGATTATTLKDDPQPPKITMSYCGIAGDTPDQTKKRGNWYDVLTTTGKVNWWWNWKLDADRNLPDDWLFVPNSWGQDSPKHGPSTDHQDGMFGGWQYAPMWQGWNEPDQAGICVSDPGIVCEGDDLMKPSCPFCQSASGLGWWNRTIREVPTDQAQVVTPWQQNAITAKGMGYETTSPQIASKIKEWLQPFLGAVCQNPMTCPDWINFHFYIMGCTTDVTGLQEKLQEVLDVVKLYPSIKGALLTEVGLLQSHPGETCDGNTIQKAMTNMFQALDEVKMPNDPAKPLVQYISWFNKINTGKSFDLSLVEAGTGNVTDLGRVYAGLCSKKQEYMNSVSK